MSHSDLHPSHQPVRLTAGVRVHLARRVRIAKRLVVLLVATLVILGPALWLHAQQGPAQTNQPDRTAVHVAMLTYDHGKTGQCFAPGFLTTVARQTNIHIVREFSHTTLDPEKLQTFPFIVMTGQDAFTLSDQEQEALKNYLKRGGFLLASPGCSNEPWNKSFRKLLNKILPSAPLTTLPMDHPIFHTIYNITELPGRKAGTKGSLQGVSLDGRLVVVYCDLGLNDTANAGGGCCCCGGNELRDAQRVNANILTYVLTH